MATLKDTLKIDGYETMTAEQKIAALEALQMPTIDTSKYVEKTLYDSKVSDLAAKNKRVKELEAAQLSDEERLKQERETFEAEKRQFNRERNTNLIKGIFADGGIKDYGDLEIDGFEDADKAKRFANAVVKVVKAQREAAEAEARNSLIGGKSAPASGITPDAASKLRADYNAAASKGDALAMATIITEAAAKGVSLT